VILVVDDDFFLCFYLSEIDHRLLSFPSPYLLFSFLLIFSLAFLHITFMYSSHNFMYSFRLLLFATILSIDSDSDIGEHCRRIAVPKF
jgi:hypothetical protein